MTEVIEVPPRERRAYSLSNKEVLELGRMALALESHYGRPLEIDWTKDGRTGEIFVVEVRAETRHSGNLVAKTASRLGRRAKRRWFPFR